MKKPSRKLQLGRKTVAMLVTKTLADVAGGSVYSGVGSCSCSDVNNTCWGGGPWVC